MSDSSRAQLLISPETVFNEVPATGPGPSMQKLRFLKESIVGKNSTEISQEIRSDRSRSDLLLVGQDVSGAVDFELSAISFDALLEAAICGTWGSQGDVVTADGVSTNLSKNFSSASVAFVIGDIGKTFVNANFPVGSYIESITSGTVAVISNAATASGSSLSFTIKARTTGNIINNGVTNRSFLVEKGYLDIGQYFSHRGMTVDTLDLSVASKSIIKGSFGFMGTRPYRATSSVSGAILAPTTTTPMTSGPFVTGLEANTNMTGIKIRSLNLSLKNNLRARDHVESLSSDEFGRGPQDVDGTFEAYFSNPALWDQFIANGQIDFSFALGDGNKSYTFRMPKMKISDSGIETPGVDADVTHTVSFKALFDATLGCHLRVTRV